MTSSTTVTDEGGARPSETGSRASTEPQSSQGLGPSGFDPSRFDVERLAYFIGVVEAIGKAGLSPGFGRVTEEDETSFTISLTIFNSQVERMVREKPDLLAEGRRVRALNPIPKEKENGNES